ncbi:MAG: Abi family protein [Bacteroidales bacterium]|nr:Abi family protein [Candidatus Scybalocola fimicaballi]
MSSTVPFRKSFSKPHDLVSLLISRGLSIQNPVKAERYIERIGYYRLSAYMYPFLNQPKTQHHFKKGASFAKVLMLYRFDKKFRLLLFNEIEKIEIAVRTAIVDAATSIIGDPFWMTNMENYVSQNRFDKTMLLIDNELRHTREDFIIHFRETYSDSYPPAWILSEILPFGVITNIYSNIKNKKIMKRISQSFGLQIDPSGSWLTIIGVTRNSCCHHSRVWNKKYSIMATLPNRITRPWITLPTDRLRIYFTVCIIKYFLDIISPENDMHTKLRWLFVEFPEVDLKALGFPIGWEMEPLWK